MEITPGIHRFDTDPFNWYVIEEGGRLTLVDAGFPGHYTAFLRGLETMGRSLQDVEAIIITHAHADHMGFAERVRRDTGAPLFVHREDQAALSRRLELPWFGLLSHAWHPFMASMLARAVVSGLLLQPGISHALGCVDGQILDVPGRPVVLHAPGHTPGEIALHLPKHDVLLSGDVLITRNLINGDLSGPQLAHNSLNSDTKEARRSLDRLRELGRVTMLPGHGLPWRGEMSEAIELALR